MHHDGSHCKWVSTDWHWTRADAYITDGLADATRFLASIPAAQAMGSSVFLLHSIQYSQLAPATLSPPDDLDY